MFYEIKLDLILTDFDETPAKISEILSLNPTKFWLKGESIQKSAVKRKKNGWVLSSELDKNEELENHIDALFSKIKPVLSNFNNLPSSIQKELSCTVYIYYEKNNLDEEHHTPSIHLENKHIELLNQLGAAFDLDLYVLQVSDPV